jgi:hypothetical protein
MRVMINTNLTQTDIFLGKILKYLSRKERLPP